jgi:virginiamycin B lyase
MTTMLKPTMLAMVLGGLAVPATAVAPAPDIREWPVPWEDTRPRDPYVDAKGRVWFVGQAGNYVAYLDPATDRFERYEVEAGTHPHNLVVDAKGMVWFTGNRNGRLVRLDPASRKLTNYPVTDPEVGDPHTMIFDRAGNAWFTAQQAGAVGRLEMSSGKFRIWRTGSGTRPYGIVADEGGRIWFDLFGTNEIGAIDPKTMELKRYALPEGARPRRIGVTSDGMVWYGDYARGYLGRLDPASGAVREFALPGGGRSLPYALAVDDRDRIWVAETGVRPNRLVAFDPDRGAFTEPVSTEGGDEANTIRHMVYHAPTREIWFGTDRNTVGRLTVR